MFSVHAVRKRSTAEIHASGDLVFEHVREFVDVIHSVVEKKAVLIDLTQIEQVDLAGLQTLYALQKGVSESGYSITISLGENRDRIRRISEYAGLRMLSEVLTDDNPAK